MERSLLVRVFEAVTGTRAQARTAAAVSRFGPYLVGMVVAKGLSTVGQLLVSRWLGPSEFGRLAVVISTSTLLASPLAGAWGGTLVRYGAGQAESTWRPLLGWASRRALRSTLLLGLAIALLSPILGPTLSLPPGLLIAGAGLGIAMGLWLFAKAASQGRENWRRFVACEVGFGGILVLLPCLLMLHGEVHWWKAGLVFAAAYVAGSLPAWPLFRAARASAASGERPGRGAGGAATYVRFAFFTGAANTAALYGDRFAAQYSLGFAEVGIYQVYNFATVGVALLVSTMLYNFVFPLFPQGDRRAFAALFRTSYLRLLPLLLAGLFCAGWVQIELAGFPFRPALLATATLTAAALVASGFYGHLTASLGVNGVQLGSKVAVATLVLFAIGVLPAVRLGGLAGLFALYAVINLSVAVFYDQALRRLAHEPAAAPIAESQSR